MSDDTSIVISLNFAGMFASDVGKKVAEQLPVLVDRPARQLQSEFGLELSNVSRFTLGGRTDDPGPVMVFELSQPVTAKAALEAAEKKERKEETAGGVTLYVSERDGDDAVAFVDGRTVVAAPVRILRDVLRRSGAPKLSGPMQAELRQMDFTRALVAVFAAADMKEAVLPPLFPDEIRDHEKLQGCVLWAEADTDLTVAIEFRCADRSAAMQIQKAVKEWIDGARQSAELPGEAAAALNAVKATVAKNRASAQVTVPWRIVKLMAQQIADRM
jgi:hypothetical protein